MAISWGAANAGSGAAMRLGYELTYSPSSVTSSTTSVTVTLRLYIGTRYGAWDDVNSYSVSGDFSASGSRSINHTSSSSWSTSNVTLIGSWTKTVSLSYTSRAKVSFSASMSGVEAAPGTARVSGAITLPLRPVSTPSAPTNVTVTRSSDTGHWVSWTRNATTGAPYDRQLVQRWDNVGEVYKTIATISGTATSFSDQSTVANRRYRWQVRAVNAAAISSTGESNRSPYVYTTPAAPSATGARKLGADILVSWVSASPVATGWEVVERQDGGAWDYANPVTLPIHPPSWLHVNPDPTVTHQYAIRAVAGGLKSGWVQSPTVQLQAPPAAPTNLQPSSGAVDATESTTLTWNHSPVDTTDQTAYELRHRLQGGEWTTTGRVLGTTPARVVAANTWDNGRVVEWQVRNWAEHADPSPWSALATFGTSARPTATVLSPTGTLTGSVVRVQWAFYDAEDSAQTLARVTLYSGSGAILERQTVVGPTTAYTFSTRAEDGQEYSVGVQVRDSAGVWSLEAVEPITVSYLPPPTAVVEPVWDLDTGTVSVQISHPEPTEAEVPGVSCDLWRSANGADWVRIAEGLPLSTTVIDMIPAVEGVNHYRVETVSASPSTITSPAVALPVDSRGWIFINAGPNFSEMVKVRDNANASYTPTRARGLHHFAGRQYPVEVAGEARSLGISLSVRLGGGSSTWAEIEALLDGPAPLLYRDYSRREFVGNPSYSHSHQRIIREASLSFERIDHRE
ncbi:fibronectin type III domain-containing protein [Micrococcus terreus]|uniref:fibronectin type III domain-containing protein n=1 Tax=Micrococcus terreus TaxID=574650 RepID=UPI0033E8CB96